MKNKIETTGGDGISFFLLVCLFAGAATSDSFKSLSLSFSTTTVGVSRNCPSPPPH